MGWGYLGRFAARARTLPRAGGVLAAVLLALATANPALAQDKAVAVTRAEILDPILIGNEADMDFGQITPRGTTGTVVMTPSATATCTPNNGILHAGTCRAAEFSGDVRFWFLLRITKPAGGQTTLVGPGGATMVLNNFTFGVGSGLLPWGGGPPTEQRYRVISLDGTFNLYVGGTLQVAGNQAPGIYNGTFNLVFNYD